MGSASQVRVRKNTSTSAVLVLTRPSKPSTPRRTVTAVATASAGIQSRPSSHQCPCMSSGSRKSLTTVIHDSVPVITKWALKWRTTVAGSQAKTAKGSTAKTSTPPANTAA